MTDIERAHQIWFLAKDKDGQIDLLQMTVHCTPAEANTPDQQTAERPASQRG